MIPELRSDDALSPQSKPVISGSPSMANSPHDSQFSEHPFGEHPSRTLFVRNINSNIEEQELRNLFEVGKKYFQKKKIKTKINYF